MALAAKLALKQSQSLVMTPQLMQSIRLLQMTHVELQQFVEEEMQRNPLLEAAGEVANLAEVADVQPDEEFSASQDHEAGDWMRPDIASAADLQANFDAPVDNLFPDDAPTPVELSPDLSAQWKQTASVSAGTSEDFDYADVMASPVTLRDHVAEQIAFALQTWLSAHLHPKLADGLDESGYLRLDPIAAAERLGLSAEQAGKVLRTLQTFDPQGLFARDLAECLAIQLKAKDRFDPAMEALVAHLDLLAKRDLSS